MYMYYIHLGVELTSLVVFTGDDLVPFKSACCLMTSYLTQHFA